MQLRDQPWQQSLSLSKTKQLLYNCSNPRLSKPLASQFDFSHNFSKQHFDTNLSELCRNMQGKKHKRDRWWHARSKKGEPLPKAALANQSPGWCAMIWYALPFPFTQREDDNAHPSQDKKRPNAHKNCSKKFQTPAYNFVTNSWSDLRVKGYDHHTKTPSSGGIQEIYH